MDQNREDEIIHEVLLGDAQAFEILVRRYQGPVYGLMLRKTGDVDDAADLAQDAFIRAYEKLGKFTIGMRFFPWLYALSLNIARDWLRAKGRDKHVSVADVEVLVCGENGFDTQEIGNGHLDGRKAFALIMQLEEKYREALILRFRHDCTMQEISLALNISVSGAKMRVQRGLIMVQERFKEASNGR